MRQSGKRLHATGICDCCDASPELETDGQFYYLYGLWTEGDVFAVFPSREDAEKELHRRGWEDCEVVRCQIEGRPRLPDKFAVLGYCGHGYDLDREFCPKGCRI